MFVETASGARADRSELSKLLEQVRKDDQIIVWRLDRPAISLRNFIDIADRFGKPGVTLRSLTENIRKRKPLATVDAVFELAWNSLMLG